MQIFFGFEEDKRVMQLPINPPALEVSEGANSETYEIIGKGEINIIKSLKLSRVSFESFFPAQSLPFLSSEKLYEPMWYVNTIKKLMDSKEPIHFVVSSDNVKINWDASIESFEWNEKGGAVGDIDFSIELKKHQPYGAKKVELIHPSTTGAQSKVIQQSPPRPDNRPKAKTYTIRAGDSLWKIAKSQLGDGNKWREIQKINNISDSQLKKLKAGTMLKLPG